MNIFLHLMSCQCLSQSHLSICLSEARIPGGGLLPSTDVRMTVLPLNPEGTADSDSGDSAMPDLEKADSASRTIYVVQGQTKSKIEFSKPDISEYYYN